MRGLIIFLQCLMLILGNNAVHAQKGFKGKPTGLEKISSSNLSFEKQVLVLVNAERKKFNLKPLKLDENLTQAARYHCKDMAEENYFGHSSQDRNGNSLSFVCKSYERMMKFDNTFTLYAENISAGQRTPHAVVQDWMDSPGHRKNILDPRFTHIGLAFIKVDTGEYFYFWGQAFGRK